MPETEKIKKIKIILKKTLKSDAFFYSLLLLIFSIFGLYVYVNHEEKGSLAESFIIRCEKAQKRINFFFGIKSSEEKKKIKKAVSIIKKNLSFLRGKINDCEEKINKLNKIQKRLESDQNAAFSEFESDEETKICEGIFFMYNLKVDKDSKNVMLPKKFESRIKFLKKFGSKFEIFLKSNEEKFNEEEKNFLEKKEEFEKLNKEIKRKKEDLVYIEEELLKPEEERGRLYFLGPKVSEEHLNDTKKEISEISKKIAKVDDFLKNKGPELSFFKEDLEAIKKDFDEYNENLKKYEERIEELKSYKDKFSEVEAELEKNYKERKKLVAEFNQMESKLRRIRQKL